jgi:N-acetylmuramoyl-L-alanine amidase
MLHLPRKQRGRVCPATWRRGAALLLLAVSGVVAADVADAHHVTAVRFWSLGAVTRIAIQTDGDFQVKTDHLENPDRIFYDLSGTKPALTHKALTVIPVSDRFVKQIRVAEPQHNITRVVLDLETAVEATTSRLENPDRLIIELRAPGGKTTEPAKAPVKTPPASVQTLPASIQTPPALVEPTPAPRPVEHRQFAPPPTPSVTPVRAQEAALDPPPVLASKISLPTSAAGILNSGMNYKPGPPPPNPAPPAPASPPASLGSGPLGPSSTTVLAKTTLPVVTSSAVNTPAPPAETALPAKRNSTGERSMIRALGLKVGRVVLDPGHGGHDTGTIGPGGLREKDLVLDVSQRLGRLIGERMGSEVIYTRSDDTFIPWSGAPKSRTKPRRTCSCRSTPTPPSCAPPRGWRRSI